LSSNNLQGTIPVAFAQQSFTQLQLNSNKFYGTLPEKLFEIPTLEFLSLSNNAMIKGPLPEILSPSLKRLYLSYNAFYGTVPESWGSSNLRVVDVYSNQLRCPFPMSLMEKFKARVSAMFGFPRSFVLMK
jgi:Leucine-rich repeat (LRR) protein